MGRIKISLSVYGTAKSAMKDSLFELDEGTDVLGLLRLLDTAGSLPKRFGNKEGYQDMLVFVNHKNVASSGGFAGRKLNENDKVLVIQAVAGG